MRLGATRGIKRGETRGRKLNGRRRTEWEHESVLIDADCRASPLRRSLPAANFFPSSAAFIRVHQRPPCFPSSSPDFDLRERRGHFRPALPRSSFSGGNDNRRVHWRSSAATPSAFLRDLGDLRFIAFVSWRRRCPSSTAPLGGPAVILLAEPSGEMRAGSAVKGTVG